MFPSHHQYVFNYSDGDVFGCVADIGWITGHSYSVYGPLANGGTTVLFESTPIYPDPGTIERQQMYECIRLVIQENSYMTKIQYTSICTVNLPICHMLT